MNRKPGNGPTTAKIGLIAVLSVVLVAVIAFQVLDSGTTAASLAVDKTTVQRQAVEQRDDTGGGIAPEVTTTPARETKRWERISREEAWLHDPFRVPECFRVPYVVETPPETVGDQDDPSQQIQREREQFLETLRTQGVGMVMSTPNGTVATIGTVTVHVGDVISGLRVAEITPSGVVLVEE